MLQSPMPRFSCDSFPTFQQPVLTGRIKTSPTDFRVSEILGYEPAGHGEHLYLQVEKTGANSGWVAGQLADAMGVRNGDVGFAGRKDRHAVTTQWYSVYLPGVADTESPPFDIEGVKLLRQTRHLKKLRRGEIEANEFDLLIRHRTLHDADYEMLESALTRLGAEGFPNYFGRQRFGRDGGNLTGADRLLREKARGQRNRSMLISAARSWLFNRYLGGVFKGDPLDGEGPLIGKSRDPQPGEAQLDEVEQAWVAGLRREGVKVGTRALWVIPEKLTWHIADASTRLSFRLPPGSYATTLLDEVFEVEDVSGD